MFTGIIECVGTLQHLSHHKECLQLIISCSAFPDLIIGESIGVNGVCLTMTEFSKTTFQTTVVPETLRKTNLSCLQVGGGLNLERSLPLNGRLGGHYVQGHVDGTGEILEWRSEGEDVRIATICIPEKFTKYIVDKGYIAVDGMSLTVIKSEANYFTVTLVPHTLQATIAKQYQVGTLVNFEVDILSKYVEKLLGAPHAILPHTN